MSALTEGPLKGPFSYNDYGTMIACAGNPMCLEIRGWGYLTGRGALALKEDVAIKHQDAFAEAVVTALNGYDEQAAELEKARELLKRTLPHMASNNWHDAADTYSDIEAYLGDE